MLREYQNQFKKAALNNDLSKIDKYVFSCGKQKQLQRFSIYRNTIFLSLIESLSHVFSTVLNLVGEDNFKVLTREFIKHHLPEEAHLSAYGGKFSDFIRTQPQVISDIPYLADLACLDWQRHLSYFAEDCDTLDMISLSAMSPEDMFSAKLTLAKSVMLFKSNFPVSHLLKMESLEIETLSLEEEFLLTQRLQGSENIQTRRVTEADFTFLNRIQAGDELGEAFIATSEVFPDFDLQEALTQSFHNMLISHISV